MGQLIFIVGKSGSGKSTSLRNLDENSTIIINTDQKALPFRNFKEKYNEEKGNYLKTSDVSVVVSKLKEAHKNPLVKTIIIDTISRLGTDFIMSPAFRAERGFDKWNKLSGAIYDLINIINDRLRDDIIVYLMGHPDTMQDDVGMSSQRLSMPGKQLDKFMLESFSSIVLYTDVAKNPGKGNEYFFSTQCNNNTAKTPIGLFEEELIPNDLVEVNKAIQEYYGI
jgi:energy-coupling factor transporter ATP-binding protein EcfA2